jgi:protein tyrosine/serine phosphatase
MNLRPLLVFTVVIWVAAQTLAATDSTNRPPQWAMPIEMKGVPNFYRVTTTLYRSAQPTAEGMQNLKRYGIKTIVSLRAYHSDKDKLRETDLGYHRFYMKTWHPEEKDVVQFLRIVTDPSCAPVLVHCQHGADRTGTLCAIYRVAVQGWTKEEALKEMQQGGYGFHSLWKNLVSWVQQLDIDQLKRKAEL